jgi:hypothetical protein
MRVGDLDPPRVTFQELVRLVRVSVGVFGGVLLLWTRYVARPSSATPKAAASTTIAGQPPPRRRTTSLIKQPHRCRPE